MRDIAAGLEGWLAEGRRFAIGTVVETRRSAPRPAGASMAVAETGEAIGSVSGGCVEGAVYELAQQVLATGEPALRSYGVAGADAPAVGLTCGGGVDVLVRSAVSFAGLADVLAAIRAGRPVASATVIAGPVAVGAHLVVHPTGVRGTLGDAGLDAAVVEATRGLLAHGATTVIHVGAHGERRRDEVSVFVQSFAPAPRMLVFGAIDFAGAVARIGKFLGYHVTVCDARPVFATRARFPDADELVVQWPHRFLETADVDERTVICVLTHDPKFDVPVLARALETRARYVGAMGSRRTHRDRLERLRAAGVREEAIARLSSPIGLDLGARTPEETAVAIAAEIVALTWHGSGRRLSLLESAIHR